ncbi:HD domain-containing protein [Enhygromyxa salina]|uniref:Guanosine-3',5'-bis(Diphosphate) 3'-pyrophosphohydrolase n=1 Tax=Enhygromyxa salina TaxID=215803 RepID=A0A2S9YYC4_9BACT|nr:HD domain-containing protein [Enhygromyxa salina]PRQ10084.1 Guanosine-3',5'-bis(diphosphate) 3'-pyrophosphohydrolase [Enhygromyxa salina]
MSLWSPDAWLTAWRFAAEAHRGQHELGTGLPYLVHVGAVAMEVANAISVRAQLGVGVARPDLAIQCALLHDVVEDTSVSAAELAKVFGSDVADGVRALSKDSAVGDKPAQMRDSLARIRQLGPEIWMVKLGDRITNLQAPPSDWKPAKIRSYRDGAIEIHAQLGEACPVLGPRLLAKIASYAAFM